MIFVNLQVVAILCTGYHGSLFYIYMYEYKTPQDCKCVRTDAWKLGIFISGIEDQGLCM